MWSWSGYRSTVSVITSTSFHVAVPSRLTQRGATAWSHPRRRQPLLPQALTYRGELDLMFIHAACLVLDITTSSLAVQSEAYRLLYCIEMDSLFKVLLSECVLCSWHDMENIKFDLKLSHAQPALGSPVWSSQGFRNPAWEAFNHLTLVADFFACSLFSFCLCWTSPGSLTEEVFSRHRTSAVSVSSCFPRSLYVNGIHIDFSMTLFVPVEQLCFHQSRLSDTLMELSTCDEWSAG